MVSGALLYPFRLVYQLGADCVHTLTTVFHPHSPPPPPPPPTTLQSLLNLLPLENAFDDLSTGLVLGFILCLHLVGLVLFILKVSAPRLKPLHPTAPPTEERKIRHATSPSEEDLLVAALAQMSPPIPNGDAAGAAFNDDVISHAIAATDAAILASTPLDRSLSPSPPSSPDILPSHGFLSVPSLSPSLIHPNTSNPPSAARLFPTDGRIHPLGRHRLSDSSLLAKRIRVEEKEALLEDKEALLTERFAALEEENTLLGEQEARQEDRRKTLAKRTIDLEEAGSALDRWALRLEEREKALSVWEIHLEEKVKAQASTLGGKG